MSGPVDVLAVLDINARAIALLSDEMYAQGKSRIAESWSTHLVAHDKARAAVAELIEASKMANGDHSAPHDCYATGPLTGNPYMDLIVCPGCRLATALARIGGAS